MIKHKLSYIWLLTALLIGLLFAHSDTQAQTSVAEPFAAYYNAHQGMRVLGNPLSALLTVAGFPAQYFEKGRIEDHRNAETNPAWQFMYGRLTAELMDLAPNHSITGTPVSFVDVQRRADPQLRHPFSARDVLNLTMGQTPEQSGIMVPYDPQLRAAPGYIVPHYFWTYINEASLFPGSWLHDIGLPMTDAFTTTVVKNGQSREIVMQAFERAVLTCDPQNPAGWQVERGNIGADMIDVLGQASQPSQNTPKATAGFVHQFLHNVATDPASAETGWADFLSQRAKSRYVGTGHVKGSGWIPRLLGLQNTPPDCMQDTANCTVQAGNFDANHGEVLVRWTWGDGSTSTRVFQMVNEGGWKIDDVTGTDVTPDQRLSGVPQQVVGAFFLAWQRGLIDEALQQFTPELRANVTSQAQIQGWLGLDSAPRLARIALESAHIPQGPASAVVQAVLTMPDGSNTMRRFDLVETGKGTAAMRGVLP